MISTVASELGEEWKTAAGYPDYAVSNHGRIMRITRGGSNATKPGKLLAHTNRGSPYVRMALYRDQAVYHVSLHRLILETFVGEAPSPEHVAAHWDNNSKNNRLENLRWATQKENAADRIRHGTHPTGHHHPNSALTPEQVEAIRKIAERGIGYQLLARAVGIGNTTMSRVIRGAAYK